MPLRMKHHNSTLRSGDPHNGVYTNDFRSNGHAATICVTVIAGVAVLILCGLLCYKYLTRRRRRSWIDQDKSRRESIRRAVRLKLRELEHEEESTPCLEAKSSAVTFGDVVWIPNQSPEESPVPEHRKYYVNYIQQQQLYHQLHHPSLYKSGNKRRMNDATYRRDSLQLNYRRQLHARSLQGQLKFNDEIATDNQVRMPDNTDHHRLSQQKVNDYHTTNSVSHTGPNNDHHKLGQQKVSNDHTTDSVSHTGPNNDHHRLGQQKVSNNHTTNSVSHTGPNNDHHRLGQQKVSNDHTTVSVSHTGPNNDHHRLGQQKVSNDHTTDSVSHTGPNNDHHRLGQQKVSNDHTTVSVSHSGPNNDHHRPGQQKVNCGYTIEGVSRMHPNYDHHRLGQQNGSRGHTTGSLIHVRPNFDHYRLAQHRISSSLGKDHGSLAYPNKDHYRLGQMTTGNDHIVDIKSHTLSSPDHRSRNGQVNIPQHHNVVRMYPNKDHHKLSVFRKVESTSGRAQEVSGSPVNSMVCNLLVYGSSPTHTVHLFQNASPAFDRRVAPRNGTSQCSDI